MAQQTTEITRDDDNGSQLSQDDFRQWCSGNVLFKLAWENIH